MSDASDGDSVRVICGPTAAGKSALALTLAAQFGARIISADSRQIYRGFDVGTAKPAGHELAAIRHYGIDLVDPTERYSAAAWALQAESAISETLAGADTPLVVGGTGFYLRALFAPLFREPDLDQRKRTDLQQYLETVTLAELRRWCTALDTPRSHLGRTQLMRAIEVALLSGERLSMLHRRDARHAQRRARYLLVDPGIDRSAIIEKRVRRMVDEGWLDEVRKLDATFPEDAAAWKATGYREIRALVRGRLTPAAAITEIATQTRQYAKRQRTWFRNQLMGEEVTIVDTSRADAFDRAAEWWRDKSGREGAE